MFNIPRYLEQTEACTQCRIPGGCLTIATAQLYGVQTTAPILVFFFHSVAMCIPNDDADADMQNQSEQYKW